jgi:two-component system response regulator CpxR
VSYVEISTTSLAPLSSLRLSWLVPVDWAEPGAAGLELASAGERGHAAGSGRKIVLVVDDEQGLLEVVRFVLEGEGFEVETARNGVEALERLRSGMRPSLMLLDLMMPVMSGWELLDEVAKIPTLAPPPIVVLTAAGSMGVPGAAEVLRKPYDLGLLLETVERHTRDD